MPLISIEVPADDSGRAKRFYSTVFGWQMVELPDIGYTLMTAEGRGDGDTVGGITPRTALAKTPVPIIQVESIEKVLARVSAAGGKRLTAVEQVGSYGRSSYIEDTEGNVLCLWENGG